MTRTDLAEIRGELFVLKLLLSQCVGFVVGHFEDTAGYLSILEKQILDGVEKAASDFATLHDRPAFVRAAKGWLATAIEGARSQTASSPRLQ